VSVTGFRLQHELVDHARSALDRLARGEPVANLVEGARTELDEEIRRTPLLVGVEGSEADRAALLDIACGGLLGPLDRASPCAAIRVRRGDAVRFRAVGFDGSVDEAAMPAPPGPKAKATPAPRRPAGGEDVQQLERELPRIVLVAPPVWAIWLWPIRWFLRWLHREKLARLERARLALPAPDAEAPPIAIESRDLEDTPERFLTRLRELASGRGREIRGILLEIVDGPLPRDVELVELIDKPCTDSIDVVLEIEGDAVYHDDDGDRGAYIGTARETIAELTTLATTGRTIRIATRVAGTLRAAGSVLDQHLDTAEAAFRTRTEALEQLRISDTAALVSRQLTAMRPLVIARVTMLVEHLMSEVGTALDQLERIWVDEITSTASNDELKATLARIHDGSRSSVTSIVDGTKRLATSGVLGAVHDLHPELVAVLVRDHGLPESERTKLAPLPTTGAVAPALFPRTAQWSFGDLAGGRLAGLFRSFDARRSEALAKVRAGATTLRELANAELLDLEPLLHTRVGDALAIELARAVDHQVAWLAATREREETAIDRERVALAPVRQLRMTADDETRRIDERIAALRPSERGAAREISDRA
jgi:hypothetical protein